MAEKSRISNTEHPLSLGSFLSWVRLVLTSEGVAREYVPRLLFVALTTFLTSPLRVYEHARYGGAVRRTAVHPSPVFVVGHWRTGTTHLHNLICRDENFGYVTTFQAMAPGFCLVGDGKIKKFLSGKAAKDHPTREIDNIPLSFDAPQEEDFAIANMSPYSFLHLYTFPRRAPYFFERYALFRDLPEKVRAEWTGIFMNIFQKATLRAGGKRLVLKNPAHCGRIRTLLELFPHARFKFFLDASPRVRAERRYHQQETRYSIDEIEKKIAERDVIDRNKVYGALKISEEAIYIDSSYLTIDEVYVKVLQAMLDQLGE